MERAGTQNMVISFVLQVLSRNVISLLPDSVGNLRALRVLRLVRQCGITHHSLHTNSSGCSMNALAAERISSMYALALADEGGGGLLEHAAKSCISPCFQDCNNLKAIPAAIGELQQLEVGTVQRERRRQVRGSVLCGPA